MTAMIGQHLVILSAALSGCLCAHQDQVSRQTRTPGLLHLAHAGHPVGSYVLAGPRQASGGGGGGGGPHIVIVGEPGAAHVTSHQAGRESLEEIDEEIRQHYGRPAGPQGVRYVPNSSNRGLYHEARTLPGYSGSLGHPPAGPVGLPLRYGLYRPQPGHGFTQATTYVGHPPVAQTHQAAVAHTSLLHQAPQAAAYRPTPLPLAHHPSPATPLTHTLASPVLPLHGFRYPPVFVPLHAAPFNHQFGLSQSHPAAHAQYSNYGAGAGSARSPSYSGEQSEDKPQYYQGQERRSQYPKYQSNYPDAQERRPEYPGHERDYHGSGERSPQAYSEFDKNYKFGSDESGAKAATTAYQSYQDDEDTSGEVTSNEGPGSYKFFEDQAGGRGYGGSTGGGGKGVATSYQSVTLETGHSSPRYPHHSHT